MCHVSSYSFTFPFMIFYFVHILIILLNTELKRSLYRNICQWTCLFLSIPRAKWICSQCDVMAQQTAQAQQLTHWDISRTWKISLYSSYAQISGVIFSTRYNISVILKINIRLKIYAKCCYYCSPCFACLYSACGNAFQKRQCWNEIPLQIGFHTNIIHRVCG